LTCLCYGHSVKYREAQASVADQQHRLYKATVMSIAMKLMKNKVADYCKKTSNRHQEENYTCDGFFILYKHFYAGEDMPGRPV
jgi:hypothetical protein